MGKRIELTEVYRPPRQPVAQSGSAPASGAGGREFKSHPADQIPASSSGRTSDFGSEKPGSSPGAGATKRPARQVAHGPEKRHRTVKGLVEVGIIQEALLRKLEGMGLELVVRDIAKHRARQAAYRKRKGG